MMFEEWEVYLKNYDSNKITTFKEAQSIFADWKAEREKLIGALEEIKENNKVNCPCFSIANAGLAEVKREI